MRVALRFGVGQCSTNTGRELLVEMLSRDRPGKITVFDGPLQSADQRAANLGSRCLSMNVSSILGSVWHRSCGQSLRDGLTDDLDAFGAVDAARLYETHGNKYHFTCSFLYSRTFHNRRLDRGCMQRQSLGVFSRVMGQLGVS